MIGHLGHTLYGWLFAVCADLVDACEARINAFLCGRGPLLYCGDCINFDTVLCLRNCTVDELTDPGMCTGFSTGV